MTKLELPKTSFSLSGLPHWLAPVGFALSIIIVMGTLLAIVVLIAGAASDALSVASAPTPDSVLDTKNLSRIGPRLGLDGTVLPNQKQEVDEKLPSDSGQEVDIDGAVITEQNGDILEKNGVKEQGSAPADAPIEGSQ